MRFSPNTSSPLIVSGGWDNMVKVWDLQSCKLKCDLAGHTGNVNTGSLGVAIILWFSMGG